MAVVIQKSTNIKQEENFPVKVLVSIELEV